MRAAFLVSWYDEAEVAIFLGGRDDSKRVLRNDRHSQETVYMIRVQELRHKAEILRRVASIPTSGDRLVDWDLLVLADQLEEKANTREDGLKRQSEADKRWP